MYLLTQSRRKRFYIRPVKPKSHNAIILLKNKVRVFAYTQANTELSCLVK